MVVKVEPLELGSLFLKEEVVAVLAGMEISFVRIADGVECSVIVWAIRNSGHTGRGVVTSVIIAPGQQ